MLRNSNEPLLLYRRSQVMHSCDIYFYKDRTCPFIQKNRRKPAMNSALGFACDFQSSDMSSRLVCAEVSPNRETVNAGSLPVCAFDRACTKLISAKTAAMPEWPSLLAISAAVQPGLPSQVWDRQVGSAPLASRAATQASRPLLAAQCRAVKPDLS